MTIKVGEFATVVATAARDTQLVVAILDLWLTSGSYQVYSPLDVVALSVQASATPSRLAYKTVSKLCCSIWEDFPVCLSVLLVRNELRYIPCQQLRHFIISCFQIKPSHKKESLKKEETNHNK